MILLNTVFDQTEQMERLAAGVMTRRSHSLLGRQIGIAVSVSQLSRRCMARLRRHYSRVDAAATSRA